MSEESAPRRPKTPTSFDLVGMPNDDFERMCFELIRLEFPTVVRPSSTNDGGADAGLPRDGEGYERCWQSKHSKGAIPWANWKKSFEDACRNWRMEEYTFCFPRQFTDKERKTFDKHFRQADAKVKVNYWNGAELLVRLTNSDEGQRVARTFFNHSDLNEDRVLRAVEAEGRLDTGEDALDRMMPVGDFLRTRDAYFSYPASVQESDQPELPPPPGAVMHIEKLGAGVSARTSLVPRSSEAMEHYGPQFQLHPSDDEEAAKEAWPRLQAALEQGRSVHLDSGVDLTFTRMPPAFEHMVGKRLTGAAMTLTAAPIPPPFEARLTATTDRGEAVWDVLLEPHEAPDDWDVALVGEAGGMTASLLLEIREDGSGHSMWSFDYHRGDLPAAEQLAALRFLHAMSGTGQVIISDRGPTKRPTITNPTTPREFPEVAETLMGFFDDIVTVEKWANVTLPAPSEVTAAQVRALALVAYGLRNRGWSATWHDLTVNGTADALSQLRTTRNFRLDQNLWAHVLGQDVNLGHVRQSLQGFDVVGATEMPNGKYEIRLEPSDAESAQVFQEIHKGSTDSTRRPPPPPPRRGKRKQSGKRKSQRGKKGRGGRR